MPAKNIKWKGLTIADGEDWGVFNDKSVFFTTDNFAIRCQGIIVQEDNKRKQKFRWCEIYSKKDTWPFKPKVTVFKSLSIPYKLERRVDNLELLHKFF